MNSECRMAVDFNGLWLFALRYGVDEFVLIEVFSISNNQARRWHGRSVGLIRNVNNLVVLVLCRMEKSLLVDISRYLADTSIHESNDELPVDVSEGFQRIFGIDFEAAGPGPHFSRVGAGEHCHDRVGRSVSHIPKADWFFSAKRHAWSSENVDGCLAWVLDSIDLERVWHSLNESFVVFTIPRLIQMKLLIKLRFFKKWQHMDPPTQVPLGFFEAVTVWKALVGVVKVVHRKPKLLDHVFFHTLLRLSEFGPHFLQRLVVNEESQFNDLRRI